MLNPPDDDSTGLWTSQHSEQVTAGLGEVPAILFRVLYRLPNVLVWMLRHDLNITGSDESRKSTAFYRSLHFRKVRSTSRRETAGSLNPFIRLQLECRASLLGCLKLT